MDLTEIGLGQGRDWVHLAWETDKGQVVVTR
jgi:hypothetical protein